MFFSSFEQLFAQDISTDVVCIVVHDWDTGDELLIQDMVRNINGKDVNFIALRNIVINENRRNNGTFKQIIRLMERFGKPIMIYDIISDVVEQFCIRHNWIKFIDHKNGESVLCFIKYSSISHQL